jgi:menaquinone-dependent protoporphyrinogen oxidase
MKVLILYGSKYGATRTIAEKIAAGFKGATVTDLKNANPGLSNYDYIIIGSSLYAGTARKEVKDFVRQHSGILKQKQVVLFLSGLSPESVDNLKIFEANFTPELVSAATATFFLGGIFDPAKVGKMDKLIFKAVTKQSEYLDTIKTDEIKRLVKEIIN